MKAYRITKKQCQETIDKYGYVCRGCGGKLVPIDTVDNAGNPTFWAGCLKCNCFDNGCDKQIFEIAKRMVDEKNFRAYSFDKRPDETNTEEFKYWRSSQIRGATSIVEDVLKISLEVNNINM